MVSQRPSQFGQANAAVSKPDPGNRKMTPKPVQNANEFNYVCSIAALIWTPVCLFLYFHDYNAALHFY